MVKELQVKEAYKIPRNHLRSVDLIKSLQIIWAYSNNLTMGTPFPTDVNYNPIMDEKDRTQVIRCIAPWNLEMLTREVIINANFNSPSNTLNDPNYFGNAVNKIKRFEEFVSSLYIDETNIKQEVFIRMAQVQFPWQVAPNKENMMQYHKIYSYSEMSELIEKNIGISYDRLLFAGFAFWSLFHEHSHAYYPLHSVEIPISKEELDSFLAVSMSSIEEIKDEMTKGCHKDETYSYAYNPLKAKPIISFKEGEQTYLYCPLPQLLYWKFTGGLFYELVGRPDFDRCFGEAFQAYVGEIIEKRVISKTARILPEQVYRKGHNEFRTADWRVCEKTDKVFLECKTRRVTLDAKTGLDDSSSSLLFDRLSEMVVQLYKTIREYKDGSYPDDKPVKDENIYPVVVLLEDWYNLANSKELKKYVISKMEKAKLPLDYLDKMPYNICTSEELGKLLWLTNDLGYEKVFTALNDNKYEGWVMSGVLVNAFDKELQKYDDLFAAEFDPLIDSYLGR